MMQSHLRMKKAALTEAQRKMKQPSLPPVVDLKKVPGPGLGPAPGSSRSEVDGSSGPSGVIEESIRYKTASPTPPRPSVSAPKPVNITNLCFVYHSIKCTWKVFFHSFFFICMMNK